MIVALLNQKDGVGKTKLALRLPGEWVRRDQRVTLIDADPQWSRQRTRESLPRLFGVLGPARDTLHRATHELARSVRHIVIDDQPRVGGRMRSAMLAADLVLIPVQPSPLDGWGSAEMLALLIEARIYRPQLAARFVLNRCGARTVIARETALTLADHDPPLLASKIGQRVALADATRSGRLVWEATTGGPAAREIAIPRPPRSGGWRDDAALLETRLHCATRRSRTSDQGSGARSSGNPDAAAFMARLAIDITPELRRRIKSVAFHRGRTIADMLRDQLVRASPPAEGHLP